MARAALARASVGAPFDEARAFEGFVARKDIEHLRAEPRWALPPDLKDPMEYFRSGVLAAMKRNCEASQPRQAAARPTGSPKVGRNDPCPCGSGKKYKRCCLR